jgi:LysR family transcriptional activator of nhaA
MPTRSSRRARNCWAPSRRPARRGQAVRRIGALATLSRNFQISFVEPLLARTDIEVVLRSGSQAELLGALQSLAIDVAPT